MYNIQRSSFDRVPLQSCDLVLDIPPFILSIQFTYRLCIHLHGSSFYNGY